VIGRGFWTGYRASLVDRSAWTQIRTPSGDWLLQVGLPAKSGISGALVTVSPGKGGLATFSPPLDETGNSVRGQLAAGDLARQLGLDILASAAVSGE